MIKAVLFDFDGTLIDTNDLIFQSYRTAFKSVLDRDIGDEEILTLYGRPLYGSLMEYGESGEKLYNTYRRFNETLYVGDSIFDMEAGKSAGSLLCAVKYTTLTPIDKIAAFKPEFFVDSMTELADLLRSECK